MHAAAVELRVLGCLVEKQRTTPDVYPLSLNALRAACNQTTNREPVVDYDEATIRDALERLGRRRWARLAGAGGRTTKYRHLLDEALGLAPAELAALAVLMLRGPQTGGELRQRSERLHPFAAGELERTLERLAERRLVASVRRPGQKESRFVQLLGGEDDPVATPPGPVARTTAEAPPAPGTPGDEDPAAEPLAARVARLEGEVAELRDLVLALRAELG